eukprot:scaffold219399_cov28-Tisochrysis_lutea.AAC.2
MGDPGATASSRSSEWDVHYSNAPACAASQWHIHYAGQMGNPGMKVMAPRETTRNPAPADTVMSLTVTYVVAQARNKRGHPALA